MDHYRDTEGEMQSVGEEEIQHGLCFVFASEGLLDCIIAGGFYVQS